ncbi:hypothetical protein [Brachyspira pilosicoli]|uniref:hypothetical protein n=1 Tax=Brachyspira pilosicoli TaxID=52584 RepID=UPI0012F6C8C0|nr:hypothetical protein [Brachyspira pilosicoli]
MEEKIYKNKEEFIQDIIDYNSGFYNNNDYFSIVVSNMHRIIDFDFYLKDILYIISEEKNTSHFYLFFDKITFLKKCSIFNINDGFSFVSITFIDATFNEFHFQNNTVNFTFLFISCHFKKPVNFIYSKNENLIIFNKTHFDKEISFIEFDIIGICKFELVEVCKSIKFNLAEINNELLFFNPIFKNDDAYIEFNKDKGNDINRLHILNTNLNNKFIFENINIKYLNLSNTVLNDNINMIDSNIKNCLNSQTARILKNEELKKANYIKVLEYQAEETRLHKEELKEQFKENKNLKTFGDILSIELSSLYSDNGQNWIRAFICTILFPSVFFTLSFAPYTITLFILIILCFAYPMFYNNNITKYIFCSLIAYLIISFLYMFNDNSHLNFIKELFSFITPTNFNQIVYNNENPSYIHSNNTSYIQLIFKGISYFIGKIAFWYGSVQTVTAFRKFAKGA